ncbi:ribonuclease domain-containing protein [Kitasatospora viridis]|uniref:Ribonuclease T1 n=1 Tax=Kitasatospora viridis TaxID=281105 RepID=A0A561ULD2_9ACTN|nr:ribonuclease domain-containing protein [Kitasatospora viridis]TWG00171.1 ribonuclease T1 [Kitasatospora viridis]
MTNRLRPIVVAVVLAVAVALAAAYAMGRHQPAARPAVGATAVTSTRAAAGPSPKPGPGQGGVCRTRLPSQAQDTIALIAKGGPFPYRSDGIVFDNREGRLPKQPGAYYHEYTVVTPGAGDRGARRIVTGGAGEEYWTQDHYASFQLVDPRC